MTYIIKRSCSDKRALYPYQYSLKELRILGKRMGIKKYGSMKKDLLCKKISKYMDVYFPNKVNYEDKSILVKKKTKKKKTKKHGSKRVMFPSNNNNIGLEFEVEKVPNKYHNTNYKKYALNRDPIKEYCSQMVFPKFSVRNKNNSNKLWQILNKEDYVNYQEAIKEGLINKDFSEDDLAELEMCEPYLD